MLISSQTKMASWFSLSSETRLRIFEFIICLSEQHPLKLSSLATVSPEWQQYFERHTFRRLVLDSSDLAEFGRLIYKTNASRLNHITNLCLRIKLSTYDCSSCCEPEDAATITA
jgi:hypothetical protein